MQIEESLRASAGRNNSLQMMCGEHFTFQYFQTSHNVFKLLRLPSRCIPCFVRAAIQFLVGL